MDPMFEPYNEFLMTIFKASSFWTAPISTFRESSSPFLVEDLEAFPLREDEGASLDFLESFEDLLEYLSCEVPFWDEIDFCLEDTTASSDLFFEALDFMEDLGLDDLECTSDDWLSWEEIWVWLKVTTFLLAEETEFLLDYSDFPSGIWLFSDFLFVLIR